MDRVVIFVDDEPSAVIEAAQFAKMHGFKPVVISGPMSFAVCLEDLIGQGAPIAAICFDMVMPGVNNLAALGLADVETNNGIFAGSALARHVLAPWKTQLRDTEILFFSSLQPGDRVDEEMGAIKADFPSARLFAKSSVNELAKVLERIAASAFAQADVAFGAIVNLDRKVQDGRIVSFVTPLYEEFARMCLRSPDELNNLTPTQWEEMVAATYVKAGFDEVILTPRSGDLGRDVIAMKKGFGSVKFIEQVKAFAPGHEVTANDVRALLGVLAAEQNATKAIFTTTSSFAPRLKSDRFLAPFMPYRLELVDRPRLLDRLRTVSGLDDTLA